MYCLSLRVVLGSGPQHRGGEIQDAKCQLQTRLDNATGSRRESPLLTIQGTSEAQDPVTYKLCCILHPSSKMYGPRRVSDVDTLWILEHRPISIMRHHGNFPSPSSLNTKFTYACLHMLYMFSLKVRLCNTLSAPVF